MIGNGLQLTGMGRAGTLPKARIVELKASPIPPTRM